MTANPRRRRRRTQLAAILGVVLVVGAAAASVVAVATLSTSRAGESVETDARLVRVFPTTPNVAIGVVDDDDRLTAAVVGTLDPSGTGGSVVVVPVNVDVDAGFSDDADPLSARPYAAGDADAAASLVARLESALGISIGAGVVWSRDDVEATVEPWAPLGVELPEDVVDDGSDGGIVAEAGSGDLDADEIAAVLTAIDASGRSYDHHAADVAVWTALATAVTDAPRSTDVPLDEDGHPLGPVGADEVIARLLAGSVTARDLALAPEQPEPGGPDAVVVDRRDALLVFGMVSPALVSTPNPAVSFQLVARFSDAELASLGDDVTSESVLVEIIGELLFSGANVVSIVIESPGEGGATTPDVSQVRVADDRDLDDVRDVAEVIFGEAVQVATASELVDGVDVVVVVGRDALDRRARVASEATSTETPAGSGESAEGSQDVAADASDVGGDAGDGRDDGDAGTDVDGAASSGTVAADE